MVQDTSISDTFPVSQANVKVASKLKKNFAKTIGKQNNANKACCYMQLVHILGGNLSWCLFIPPFTYSFIPQTLMRAVCERCLLC